MVNDSRSLLFIAGAPRSGTTLLSNLLDGHPSLSVFPAEHGTIQNYYWHEAEIEQYARDQFIVDPAAGQQTLLANRELAHRKQVQLEAEYGKTFSEFPVSYDEFRRAYLEFLATRPATLENMLRALGDALAVGRPDSGMQVASPQTLVFKQPFFTEVFASRVASEIPDSRFIHIVREPESRYLSARQRRNRQNMIKGRRTSHINRRPYVIGSALIGIAAAQLAQKNQDLIGEQRYRVIRFEDLVTEPQPAIYELLDWLGVPVDDFPVTPTRMGIPVDSGSQLSVGYNVDPTVVMRGNDFNRLTSKTERTLFQAALSYCSEDRPRSLRRLTMALLTPLPNSSLKNYVCQLTELWNVFTKQNWIDVDGFVDAAREGRVGVSGAT